MLDPFVVAGLLEPENPVAVRYGRDDIRPAIAIYIAHVYKAEVVVELPVRMKRPVLLPRIGWSLQPTFRSQDVVPPIAVHIPHTNTVPVAMGAHNVFRDSALSVSLIPGERAIGSELRQNLVGFAVVIKIDQKGKLDGRSGCDGMFFPHFSRSSGIAPPCQRLRKPSGGHQVNITVAIHIQGQRRQIIHVIADVVYFAEAMLGPSRGLVPILPGDQVELSIAIDVDKKSGFRGSQINGVFLKIDLVRPAGGPPGGT